MNESEITVKNLFAMTEGKLPAGARSVFEASHQIPSLKENLRSQVKWLPWTLVRDDIERKIAHLLDVPLVELLTAVWKKYEILVKYADRDKYSPEETFWVPLAEHTVKSEHHPYVEVLVNGHSTGRIVFDVWIALTLEGFILKIQDARIKAVQTGSLRGKGKISLENAVLVEKAFDRIPLPASIDLGEGVPIQEAVPASLRAAKVEEPIEKREYPRLEMMLPILVRSPKGVQEIANTENLSKGGLAVPLAMDLAVGSTVRIVCPYIPERQNTEEKAEVRRRVPLSLGDQELYGLCYLR